MFISSLKSFLYKTTTKYNIYPIFCDSNSKVLERSEGKREDGEREDGEREGFLLFKEISHIKSKEL